MAAARGLTNELVGLIRFRGPITFGDYMRMCLTHPIHGYYMKRDVFGRRGDFITGPEISQVYGELVGVWCVAMWQRLGEPSAVRIVEAGPGRGTLMADMLRVIARHERLARGATVELIEVSPWMRAKQRETLCGPDAGTGGVDAPARARDGGMPVSWHDSLRDLLAPPEPAPAPAPAAGARVPTLVVAHEFLDALPVHKFRRAPAAEAGGRPGGWREVLVDVNDDAPDASCPLRLVLAPGPTPALGAYGHLLPPLDEPRAPAAGGAAAARALVGARASVRRSASAGAGVEFEVCPLGLSFAAEVAAEIASSRGAALFIDYGPARGAVADSARAIIDHRFVELLDAPGDADLSALVDFEAIGDAARAVPGVVAGAVGTQRELLGGLGLEARVNALLRGASPEDARSLIASAERLVAAPGMGEEYKAIAFADAATGVPIPFRAEESEDAGDGTAATGRERPPR